MLQPIPNFDEFLSEGELRAVNVDAPFDRARVDEEIKKRAGSRRLDQAHTYRELASRLSDFERAAGPLRTVQITGSSHYVSAHFYFQRAEVTVPIPDDWVSVSTGGAVVNVYFSHFRPIGVDPWKVALDLAKGDTASYDLAKKRQDLAYLCRQMSGDVSTVKMKDLLRWRDSASDPSLDAGRDLVDNLKAAMDALAAYARQGGQNS